MTDERADEHGQNAKAQDGSDGVGDVAGPGLNCWRGGDCRRYAADARRVCHHPGHGTIQAKHLAQPEHHDDGQDHKTANQEDCH